MILLVRLPMTDPAGCNVHDQQGVSGSMLELYRSLIAIRRSISGPVEVLRAESNLLVYRRGAHVISLNLVDTSVKVDGLGDVVFASTSLAEGTAVPAHSGVVGRL